MSNVLGHSTQTTHHASPRPPSSYEHESCGCPTLQQRVDEWTRPRQFTRKTRTILFQYSYNSITFVSATKCYPASGRGQCHFKCCFVDFMMSLPKSSKRFTCPRHINTGLPHRRFGIYALISVHNEHQTV